MLKRDMSRFHEAVSLVDRSLPVDHPVVKKLLDDAGFTEKELVDFIRKKELDKEP